MLHRARDSQNFIFSFTSFNVFIQLMCSVLLEFHKYSTLCLFLINIQYLQIFTQFVTKHSNLMPILYRGNKIQQSMRLTAKQFTKKNQAAAKQDTE